ncbi:unnamed protein product [Orchesella dallaii]|uniref:C2H2-type domain-containing protein n=1 Tax=Orchesella dallaii TaxID=48710 RepID=A0ABP1QK49_9HEXA
MDQQPTFPNLRNSGISDGIELIDLVSDEENDVGPSIQSISTPLSSALASPRQAPTTLGEAMGNLRDTLYEVHEPVNQVDDFIDQVGPQPGPSGVGTDRRNLIEPVLKKVKMDELTTLENIHGGGKKSPAATTTGQNLNCLDCFLKFENEFIRDAHTTLAHGYKMVENGRFQCSYKDCRETVSGRAALIDHEYVIHYDYIKGRLEECGADFQMYELASQENNRCGRKKSPAATTTGPRLNCLDCYLKFENEFMRDAHTTLAHRYKLVGNGRFQCYYNDCRETVHGRLALLDHLYENQ